MPKVYQEGEIPAYKTKEYYKLKMREYRKKNPEKYSQKGRRSSSQRKTFWSITINDKKYIFKTKQDIKICKIKKQDVDQTQDIVCF